jgi:hypothetical protein
MYRTGTAVSTDVPVQKNEGATEGQTDTLSVQHNLHIRTSQFTIQSTLGLSSS